MHNFDEVIERRASGCAKWNYYGADVLPMWVADMDFLVAPAITQALRERVEHGVFGYMMPPPALSETICARLQQLYDWTVTPEQILFLPGVVAGFNIVSRAIGEPGDGLLMQTPIYPPILHAPENCARTAQMDTLTPVVSGGTLRYEIDFDTFESTITARTRTFLLCNPHNPVGRVFTRDELTRLAAICERHDLIICSDEIHCDLLMGDARHTPIAALAPEVAARTVTLMAPSKSFNIPGLGLSFAIIQDEQLRKRVQTAAQGLLPLTNMMGSTAALAAYRDSGAWLTELCSYLTANRDALVAYLAAHLPQLKTTVPEGSYLAWIDCRAAGIDGSPYTFFLETAKVGLNDGDAFGPGGAGFVRLNYACPRATLIAGLDKMRAALQGVAA